MTTVRELLSVRGYPVRSVRKTAGLLEAAQKFLDYEVSSLLVYDDEQVVGILTKNDIVRRCIERKGDLSGLAVVDCMTASLFTTTLDADLEDVFREMIRRGFRHAPVMKDGEGLGILTPIDILFYQKELVSFENEELVKYLQGTY